MEMEEYPSFCTASRATIDSAIAGNLSVPRDIAVEVAVVAKTHIRVYFAGAMLSGAAMPSSRETLLRIELVTSITWALDPQGRSFESKQGMKNHPQLWFMRPKEVCTIKSWCKRAIPVRKRQR